MAEDSAEPREQRIAYAESRHEFNDQRDWYSRRASNFKTLAQRIDILIIASGALGWHF